VQVGAYAIRGNAAEAHRVLAANRFPARIIEGYTQGRYLYRVQAGPYRELADARDAMTRIRRLTGEFQESFIP
jgi:cell division protein FtsN